MPLVEGLVENEKIALELNDVDILPDCVIVSLALLEKELEVEMLTETQPVELVLALNDLRGDALDNVVALAVTEEEGDTKEELVADDEIEADMEALDDFEANIVRVAETEEVGENEEAGLKVSVPESLVETVDETLVEGLFENNADILELPETDTLTDPVIVTLTLDVAEYDVDTVIDKQPLELALSLSELK
jgi:hypothetical protein